MSIEPIKKLPLKILLRNFKYSKIDVVKEYIKEKTRDGSSVKSFKIAIKAEYLEKASKPETWPLSVKVR